MIKKFLAIAFFAIMSAAVCGEKYSVLVFGDTAK